MTNSEIIEEVLYDAYKLNIATEVMELANEYLDQGEKCKACAYRTALARLINTK